MSAVLEIEQYRFEHNITDGRTAVGSEPNDHASALAWYRVNETISDSHDVISQLMRNIRALRGEAGVVIG